MLEMNKQKQTEIKGFLGWLESYLWIIGGGPHAQDRSSQSYYEHDYESFLAVLMKNRKDAGHRPRPPGALAPGRVRGIAGQAAAITGEDQADG